MFKFFDEIGLALIFPSFEMRKVEFIFSLLVCDLKSDRFLSISSYFEFEKQWFFELLFSILCCNFLNLFHFAIDFFGGIDSFLSDFKFGSEITSWVSFVKEGDYYMAEVIVDLVIIDPEAGLVHSAEMAFEDG